MVFPIYADSDFQKHAAMHVIIVFRVGIQQRPKPVCTKLVEQGRAERGLRCRFPEKFIGSILQVTAVAQITDGFNFFGSRPKMIDSRAGKQRDAAEQQAHDEKNGQ